MKKYVYLFLLMFCGITLNAQRTCGSEVSNQNETRAFRLSNRIDKNEIRDKIRFLPEKIIIPVVVHIVHNGEPEGVGYNISYEQVKSQIEVLNEDFNRKNADAVNTPNIFKNVAGNAKIEFRLATLTPEGKDTNGIVRIKGKKSIYEKKNNPVKTELYGSPAWDSRKYLNIWICNLDGGLLGYAQFPQEFKGKENTDGVVIKTESFGRKGFVKAPYDKGRTTTHEVGHWLGLYHIWGDNIGCKNGNDFCDDTPDQYSANLGCHQNSHSCSNLGDMYMNYMDYTDDACMNIFTRDQVERMRYFFTKGQARETILDSGKKMFSCGTPSLETDAMPWGFCKKTRFYIKDLPDGSTVNWKRSGFSSKIIDGKNPSEIVVDFGKEYPARVEAVVTTPCGEKHHLSIASTNNAYICNEYVHLKITDYVNNSSGRYYKAVLNLDESQELNHYQARRFTIENTHHCFANKPYDFNEIKIYPQGNNPSVTFSIGTEDTCEPELATFVIDTSFPIKFPYIIPTQESQNKHFLPPLTEIENCNTPQLLKGQIYS